MKPKVKKNRSSAVEIQKKSIITFLSKDRHYHLPKNYREISSPLFIKAIDSLVAEGKIIKTNVCAYGKHVWITLADVKNVL